MENTRRFSRQGQGNLKQTNTSSSEDSNHNSDNESEFSHSNMYPSGSVPQLGPDMSIDQNIYHSASQ